VSPPVSERPRRAAAADAVRRARGSAAGSTRRLGGLLARTVGGSRDRRIFWAVLAVVLVVVPFGLNLARQKTFTSSIEVFPQKVGTFGAESDPAYYRGLLKDSELRLQMDKQVKAQDLEYRRVTIGPGRARDSLVLGVHGSDRARTRAFVNALGPQLANATSRQLSVTAQRRARALLTRARGERRRSVARRLRRRAGQFGKLAQAPPQRIVLGRRAALPKLTHAADRFVDGLPGGFPGRANPFLAALAGLVVLIGLWVLSLVLLPVGGRRPRPRPAPAAAPAAAAAPASAPQTVPEPHAPAPPPAEPYAEPARRPAAPSKWTSGPQLDVAIEEATGVSRRLSVVLFALVTLAAGAFVFLTSHDAFFFGDDWDMVLRRFGLSGDTLFTPHVNHLVATQILFYEGLRGVADWHYGAYRLAFLALQIAAAAGVFVFARPRIGGWLAALLVIPMLFIPGHATTIFTVGNVIALLTGLAAILVLDRAPVNRLRDVAVCLLLLLSIASFSFGLAFAAAVGIWLLATPGQRRSLWVPVIPIVTYFVWLITYDPPSPFSLHNLADTPTFVADSAAAAFGGATGLGFAWGRLLALLAAVAIGYELFTKPERRSPTTYAIVALPILLWIMIGLGRAAAGPEAPRFGVGSDELLKRFVHLNGTVGAGQSRYVYPSVVLLLLVAAQLLGGRRLRPWLSVAAVLVLVGVMTNLVVLRDTGTGLRGIADEVRGRMAAVEIAARTIPPEFGLPNFPGRELHNQTLIANFQSFVFKDAVARVGSEPVPLDQLGGLGPSGRRILDRVLVRALPVRMAASPPGSRPRPTGDCTSVTPGPTPPAVPVRGVRTIIRTGAAPVTVALRRFAAPGTLAGVGTAAPRSTFVLTIPRDRARRPWSVRVASPVRVSVCPG
jgi:hypothetical protein